jgi:anti-sigma regulatory factor (Ser/Thr protein kinase)
MKQLLIIFISILIGVNILQAQEANPYDRTSWNVIQERLFNGENAHVFRFEKDIRLQLIGAETYQDSAIFITMIAELNELLETVQIKMVNENPNFKIKIDHEPGRSSNYKMQFTGSEIVSVNLELGFNNAYTQSKSVNQIYYHTIRQLTKLFQPQYGSTGYGGIFDSDKPEDAEFKEVDKDLLKKIYSQDFYTQLKENALKTKGYQFYLNLRYKNLMRNLFLSLRMILIIVGFLFFLSKESKRDKNPTLWLYLKQRTIILLIAPVLFSIIKTSRDFATLLIAPPMILVASYLATVIYAILVLILIYYTEPFFLKRMNSFVGKQTFIFFSTIVLAVLIPISLALLFLLFTDSNGSMPLHPISSLLQSTTHLFIIAFIAGLRVFYNSINYRIQSMVNQKDVELAKMKELKNQAELNALHSRINPHFLYNSLNSIASLAHINPDKTENMATGLSELFRYSINKENKTFVSVGEELEMVRKYLEIEKTRFEDKLIYTIEAQDNVTEKLIPKFLIQPLAENAIKHGLSKIKGVGKITISVKQKEKALVITIFDNGPDFPEEPVSGYGLQNLNDKLEIIYGNDAFINWKNGENKHFEITLKNQFEV